MRQLPRRSSLADIPWVVQGPKSKKTGLGAGTKRDVAYVYFDSGRKLNVVGLSSSQRLHLSSRNCEGIGLGLDGTFPSLPQALKTQEEKGIYRSAEVLRHPKSPGGDGFPQRLKSIELGRAVLGEYARRSNVNGGGRECPPHTGLLLYL